jgi:hypothetical protein
VPGETRSLCPPRAGHRQRNKAACARTPEAQCSTEATAPCLALGAHRKHCTAPGLTSPPIGRRHGHRRAQKDQKVSTYHYIIELKRPRRPKNIRVALPQEGSDRPRVRSGPPVIGGLGPTRSTRTEHGDKNSNTGSDGIPDVYRF